jgi:hypothetical protein
VQPTSTHTPVQPTSTHTPKPTNTSTPGGPTGTTTLAPTGTTTPRATRTSTPVQPTSTHTPKPTNISAPTSTHTPQPTNTSTPGGPTRTVTVTPTSTGGPTVPWQPGPGATFYWQLNCPSGQQAPCINLSRNVQIYEFDGFDNPAQSVATLHARGVKVICYMDAGTWENWRSDAGLFPASVIGMDNGWPGERWLDIRQGAILDPILEQRANLCKAKGFDAIDWDNVDGYANTTGFPLSYQDQITFNTFLATYTHSLGLAVALKNDLDQASDLQPHFDFAFDEQCFEYDECSQELPFINAGKAVLEVEYNLTTTQFCTQANSLKLSSALTDRGSDGAVWRACQ